MKSKEQLRATLRAIDGKGYGAYKSIAGAYDFGKYALHIDYVQGDPFALPSRLRLVLPPHTAQLPPELLAPRVRRIAAADFFDEPWKIKNRTNTDQTK